MNFEHINFLKVGTTLGQPPVNQRVALLTLGQPAVCPRAIWTLTRAKSLCLCAFFSPGS